MRAVNLIPAEDRRGAGGAAGRSGGAAYALLALLAALVVVASIYAVEKKSLSDKRDEFAQIQQNAAATEARAATLTSFTQFAGLRAARVATVTSLAASRFDWSHSLQEIARVIPADVSLSALTGTVTPGVPLQAASASGAGGLRSALAVPAIEMNGCARSQDSVARMLTRLRLIDGVIRVSLQSSTKPDAGSTTPASSPTTSGCAGSAPPTFSLVVFFDQVSGAVPTTTGGTRPVTASLVTAGGGATNALPTGATTP